jgi:Ca2+-binding EF-hand superfamily protein
MSQEELMEAFDQLDRDGSGTIEKSDFETILTNAGCSAEQVDEISKKCMAEGDTNKDGKITKEEFVEYIKSIN